MIESPAGNEETKGKTDGSKIYEIIRYKNNNEEYEGSLLFDAEKIKFIIARTLEAYHWEEEFSMEKLKSFDKNWLSLLDEEIVFSFMLESFKQSNVTLIEQDDTNLKVQFKYQLGYVNTVLSIIMKRGQMDVKQIIIKQGSFIKSLFQEKEEMQKLISKLKEEIKELNENLDKVNGSANKAQQNVDKVNENVNNANENIKKVNESVDKVNENVNKAKEDIKELKENTNKVKENIKELKEDKCDVFVLLKENDGSKPLTYSKSFADIGGVKASEFIIRKKSKIKWTLFLNGLYFSSPNNEYTGFFRLELTDSNNSKLYWPSDKGCNYVEYTSATHSTSAFSFKDITELNAGKYTIKIQWAYNSDNSSHPMHYYHAYSPIRLIVETY